MIRILTLVTLLGVTGASLFGAAFSNGNFEAPAVSFGPQFSIVPTGWVKFDPSCPSCGGLFLETYDTFGLPTLGGEGVQAFGFGGNGVQSGSLSQTFDTTAGTTYLVSFQYVLQQGLDSEALRVEAFDGATSLNSNQFSFTNTAWLTSTLSFTAASGSTTLTFFDTTGPGSTGTNWALDAVTVDGQSAAPGVPEPGTFGLAGLAGIASLMLRKLRVSPGTLRQ